MVAAAPGTGQTQTAVAVAACGGATVDSDDVTDTPTVASEAETESETETTETTETSEAPSSSAVVSSQSKRVDDQPAREVTDVIMTAIRTEIGYAQQMWRERWDGWSSGPCGSLQPDHPRSQADPTRCQ